MPEGKFHPLALEAARYKGWDGGRPVREPAPKNATEVRAKLDKLAAGDHRTSLITTIANNIKHFYFALTEEDFAAFGRYLAQVVFDSRNSARPRVRAIRAALKPAIDVTEVLVKYRKRRDLPSGLMEHLEKLYLAFFSELTPEVFEQFAITLTQIARGNSIEMWNRIRTIEASMTIVMDGMKMIVNAQREIGNREPEEPTPEVLEARAQLERIRKEAKVGKKPAADGGST